MKLGVHEFRPPGDPPDDGSTPFARSRFRTETDELPYTVEVWDTAEQTIERLVAVTSSPAIGYAAYFAATREFPGHAITLRHKGSVLSRWAAKSH